MDFSYYAHLDMIPDVKTLVYKLDALPSSRNKQIIHMEREEEAWVKSFENQVAVGRNNFLIKILLLLSPTGARLQRLMNSSSE